jgi:hypothetical protein
MNYYASPDSVSIIDARADILSFACTNGIGLIPFTTMADSSSSFTTSVFRSFLGNYTQSNDAFKIGFLQGMSLFISTVIYLLASSRLPFVRLFWNPSSSAILPGIVKSHHVPTNLCRSWLVFQDHSPGASHLHRDSISVRDTPEAIANPLLPRSGRLACDWEPLRIQWQYGTTVSKVVTVLRRRLPGATWTYPCSCSQQRCFSEGHFLRSFECSLLSSGVVHLS